MKIISYILTFFLFTSVSVANHADKLVHEGTKYYQSKNYTSALEVLNQAIEDKSLHQHSVAKAHYYRGITYLALAKSKKAKAAEPFLLAFDDLTTAKLESSEKNDWEGLASEKMGELKPYLIKRGLFLFKTYDSEDSTKLQLSKMYFAALTTLEVDNYVYFDYLGQCDLALKDTTQALSFFEKAQEIALNNQNNVIDFSMGYSFYRTAKLYGIELLKPIEALEVMKNARKYIEREAKDMKKATLDISNEEYQEMVTSKSELEAVLDRLELELLSKEDGNYYKTIGNFKEALKKNGNDIPVLMAYASFIESKNPKEAIELYRRVIGVDSQYFMAYYGIGSLYVEQGTKYRNKAHKATKNEEVLALNKKGKDAYTEAILCFEKAYELNPNEPVFLQTIIQLSQAVGDQEKYQKYNQIQLGK